MTRRRDKMSINTTHLEAHSDELCEFVTDQRRRRTGGAAPSTATGQSRPETSTTVRPLR